VAALQPGHGVDEADSKLVPRKAIFKTEISNQPFRDSFPIPLRVESSVSPGGLVKYRGNLLTHPSTCRHGQD